MRPLRVLHADDDESFALLVRRALQGAPDLREACELIQVSDGRDAVDYVLGTDKVESAMPHVVILDQQMHELNGLDALRLIRENVRPETMLSCILTTSTQPDLIDACYRIAGTFHLEKPRGLQELESKLRAIVTFALHVLRLPSRL